MAAPCPPAGTPRSARRLAVRGIVQGVGFRPFVSRLASGLSLAGWVRNDGAGVEIHVEGGDEALARFVRDVHERAPAAARIAGIDVAIAPADGLDAFSICASREAGALSARISPDLPLCAACLDELFDPRDRRYRYPYINCTECGPRYSLMLGLPYDRPRTTMAAWPMDAPCAAEYEDAADRRFHAQPLACPACGPGYHLVEGAETTARGDVAIRRAAALLAAGAIVAVKGIGGFHLACDARDPRAVSLLRERKFRKERPFALMAGDLDAATAIVELSADAAALLTSRARPIVLAPARVHLPSVAPDEDRLGVMLPYAPVHYLLFASGAPRLLVMTSANRSSEPIAFEDDDARQRLAGLADAFLIGERPIARRIDDSVARAGALGPVILRRSRGYAPEAVALLPADRPVLAVGADLKNAVTLVVDGQAFVAQHVGDLDEARSLDAFRETIRDLLSMYRVDAARLVVAHDRHPEYASTRAALELPAAAHVAVQHHRAHVASVLAEHEELDRRALGISFDGTGFGDDGTIWGGELFIGSVRGGFDRVAHLRRAVLPGGDAAARHPVRAAAGFLAGIDGLPDLEAAPFSFPREFRHALRVVTSGMRTFTTTSAGRLFDTVAALLGFVRPVTFEGQAAIWVETLARRSAVVERYPFPWQDRQLDYVPLLRAVIADRAAGRPVSEIARAFHRGVAAGTAAAAAELCARHGAGVVVASGGVFQNDLLLRDLHELVEPHGLRLLGNHAVPPNDGGISLGQAALATAVLEP